MKKGEDKIKGEGVVSLKKIRISGMVVLMFLIGMLGAVVCNHHKYINAKISLQSVEHNNTGTKKVPVDDTVFIAQPSIYKDMDYGFLKGFSFGEEKTAESVLSFETVSELKTSTSVKLKEGNVVCTKGYYVAGDGGACCYMIQKDGGNGSIALTNGLYAKVLPDSYKDKEGKQWLLVNVKQFGAKGDGTCGEDGKNGDNYGINEAIRFAGELVNRQDSPYARGIVYLPQGEYKCTDQLFADTKNLNIVGEGDKTIIFTDNDYRKDLGYSEHFFQITGAENMFFGKFQIEAREVDLYHYMRQFTLTYCKEIYVYEVDLIIPQRAYSSYYFEDKQYSNFCCYSGNRNITIDGCKMVQLSGTYRGANVGILDIWAAGEENITIMNCDLYGNARDEQIGFFSRNHENASVKHVDFINNTVHSVQLKYVDIIGHRTMCFSVAYTDSRNIEDIRIAGNHFICEADSKFMTFGTLKQCVVENNIMEIVASHGQLGYMFDSANSAPEHIVIRNNEIFLTNINKGQGKQSIIGGALTFEGNRFLTDTPIPFHFAYSDCVARNNEIICLEKIANLTCNSFSFEKNKAYLYGGMDKISVFTISDKTRQANVNENVVYNYERYIGSRNERNVWSAINQITGTDLSVYNYRKNQYYAPNLKYTGSNVSTGEEICYERILYIRNDKEHAPCTINIIGNKLQGTKGYISYGNLDQVKINEKDNSLLTFSGEEEKACSSVSILKDGKEVKELTVTRDQVSLEALTKVADSLDDNGNPIKEKVASGKKVKWYTSVESIATVSEDGVVTRNMYGDVKVYAVPLDGSKVYGECILRFEEKKAQEIIFKEKEIYLEPGLKFYGEYVVLPENETSQHLTWKSSDETVATVSETGTITAVGKGTAQITGTTKDGSDLSKSITVYVDTLTVKKIELDKKYEHYGYSQIGSKVQLSVSSYVPEQAGNCSIGKWISMDEEVVQVDKNGLVTLVGPGKAEVRAYSTDNSCYGWCWFYVDLPKVEHAKLEEIKNTSVKLTWDGNKKAYGYFVYSWNTGTSKWDKIGEVLHKDNVDAYSYVVNNLQPNSNVKLSLRPYIYQWSEEGNIYYEGQEVQLTAKTLSYEPVTKLWCSSNCISLVEGATATFNMSYSPKTANYKDLNISFSIKDNNVATIKEIESKEEKRIFELQGKRVGFTTVTIKANDAWGVSMVIPVGVVPNKLVSAETINVEKLGGKVKITFRGVEDEAAIDGYMLRRTESVEYSNIQFVKKANKETYTCLDDTVKDGVSYSYSVTPCITDGTNYFVGYDSGRKKISMTSGILTQKIIPQENIFTVVQGEELEIYAKILPADVSNSILEWTVADEDIAQVERIKNNEQTENGDYAKLTGKKIGVTRLVIKSTDEAEVLTKAAVYVVPPKISNVQYASTASTIGLTWNIMEGVDGYYVYNWSEEKKEWFRIGDVKENEYIHTQLKEASVYKYRIAAYVQCDGTKQEGATSDTVTAFTATDTLGIEAVGYLGDYDGKSHEALTLYGIQPQTDTVTYSTDGVNWTPQIPLVTNVADSKIIYICITRGGIEQKYYLSVLAKVNAASIGEIDMHLEENEVNWDGKQHRPKVVVEPVVTNLDYIVLYEADCRREGIYNVTVKGIGNYKGSKTFSYKIVVSKGETYCVKGYRYKVTGAKTVSCTGAVDKGITSVKVNSYVTIGAKKYTITKVANGAFKDYSKLKTVFLGAKIKEIGKNAFKNCRKIQKVTLKGNDISKVGSNAIKGINKKAKLVVPKKRIKKYKKIFSKKTGYVSTMQWKKNA